MTCTSTFDPPGGPWGPAGPRRCMLAVGHEGRHFDNAYGWDDQPGELAHLRRWKAEALPLLDQIDRCHELLPAEDQALLGRSKVAAIETFIRKAAGEDL